MRSEINVLVPLILLKLPAVKNSRRGIDVWSVEKIVDLLIMYVDTSELMIQEERDELAK